MVLAHGPSVGAPLLVENIVVMHMGQEHKTRSSANAKRTERPLQKY